MSFIVGTVYYWWTIKSRLHQRKLYQFTLQNYIPSSNTHLLTLYNTDFFFFGMKLKWKPALFTLFLPSGDNLRLGGRPTPPWKVFGQGIFDLPCHYFACEEAKPRCRGVGMSKHLVGSIQCDGHNVPPSVDLTRTFQTTTKCNNINHVWSQFYTAYSFWDRLRNCLHKITWIVS